MPIKILDVGGGDGSFARKRYHGDYEILTIDLKNGYDVVKQGIPKGSWDIILANHFIEHIADPDSFLDDVKLNMTKDTVLDIGIPNLSAWFNRFFFLFGYLPHSYELSYSHNLGKPFDWNNEELGGHIRVFNTASLVQLLRLHDFEIFSVAGEASTFPCPWIIRQIDKFLTLLNPNLASSARVLCKLKSR